MFEQVCLSCGKHLAYDDRPYCSDKCETGDLTSPPLSSATSSTFSSPYLPHQDGSLDVPPLALNAALLSTDLYSSSASSTCWSATDDEDGEGSAGYTSDYRYPDETVIEPHSKPINFMPLPRRSSHMSFARRPSGLNNPGKTRNTAERSLSSSSSIIGTIHGEPRSAPIQSHFHPPSSEDELFSDVSAAEEEQHSSYRDKKPIQKSRRTKNRASLPAYFSLLAFKAAVSPPLSNNSNSNSSSNTLSRGSPPTPRVDLSVAHAITTSAAPLGAAPRGRRKVIDRSERADSASSSRDHSMTYGHDSLHVSAPCSGARQLATHSSVEQIFDWSTTVAQHAPPTNIRRNSSPPPNKMEFSRAFTNDAVHSARKADDPARNFARERERRGRYRVEELHGLVSNDAPGLGIGRSGLVGRRGTALPR
ncbi:hypothetical protein DL96DRAFT_1222210 [Flagelloscypha sp. PMI_526]|nr:hypothetical protein DL96DRAFT_1222210 [Flagelloscypha sp. PMI_526]